MRRPTLPVLTTLCLALTLIAAVRSSALAEDTKTVTVECGFDTYSILRGLTATQKDPPKVSAGQGTVTIAGRPEDVACLQGVARLLESDAPGEVEAPAGERFVSLGPLPDGEAIMRAVRQFQIDSKTGSGSIFRRAPDGSRKGMVGICGDATALASMKGVIGACRAYHEAMNNMKRQ